MVAFESQELKDALERGVRIRSITEKSANERRIRRQIESLKKSRLYELRYISAPAPLTLVIVDKKELNICISNQAASSLWSNNAAIMELAINYFEDIWQRATKDKTEITPRIVNQILDTKFNLT